MGTKKNKSKTCEHTKNFEQLIFGNFGSLSLGKLLSQGSKAIEKESKVMNGLGQGRGVKNLVGFSGSGGLNSSRSRSDAISAGAFAGAGAFDFRSSQGQRGVQP